MEKKEKKHVACQCACFCTWPFCCVRGVLFYSFSEGCARVTVASLSGQTMQDPCFAVVTRGFTRQTEWHWRRLCVLVLPGETGRAPGHLSATGWPAAGRNPSTCCRPTHRRLPQAKAAQCAQISSKREVCSCCPRLRLSGVRARGCVSPGWLRFSRKQSFLFIELEQALSRRGLLGSFCSAHTRSNLSYTSALNAAGDGFRDKWLRF